MTFMMTHPFQEAQGLHKVQRCVHAPGRVVLMRAAGQAEGADGQEALLVAAQLQEGPAVLRHALLHRHDGRLHAGDAPARIAQRVGGLHSMGSQRVLSDERSLTLHEDTCDLTRRRKYTAGGRQIILAGRLVLKLMTFGI